MSHEVELKFDLAPEDVARLLACPALAGQPVSAGRYKTAYFDTKDGALREAGMSLRVRRAGGRHVQTVKRKRGSAAGLFVRQEWEADVAGLDVDQEALKATPLKRLPAADRGALACVLKTDFRRTAWQIAHGGSRIEVALDEGKVKSGKAQAPLCEVELELIEGKPRALFDLAEEIAKAVPLRLGVLTTAERGQALAERRLGKAARGEPVALAATLSEEQAFRAVAHACLRHYRLNEIVLLEARDADALHQARIALRRLRSAFSLFRPTARGKDYQALRDELGWLAGQLGDARNLDVLLAGKAEPAGDDHLHARLEKARGKAYDRVEAALGSKRALTLMLRLALWIEIGAWRFRERGSRDVADLARHQLERQWRKVRRHGAKLRKADPEQRHRLRLDVKRLRYAAEFLAGLWEKRRKAGQRDRFIAALKDLQDRLGDLGDADTAEAMTARLAPGLRGNAESMASAAMAGESVAASEEAFARAGAAAGYWL